MPKAKAKVKPRGVHPAHQAAPSGVWVCARPLKRSEGQGQQRSPARAALSQLSQGRAHQGRLEGRPGVRPRGNGEAGVPAPADWPRSPGCDPGQLCEDQGEAPMGEERLVTGPAGLAQSGEGQGRERTGTSRRGIPRQRRPPTSLYCALGRAQGWGRARAGLCPRAEKSVPNPLQLSKLSKSSTVIQDSAPFTVFCRFEV
ncbi:hypothetical protein HJG60_010454 [Phyllostomus discolor]|uniref:Uncharacterized protein n=1 Tax=Phyllostomus discolor TaxID=89673 RepID=A0A834ARW8_9CHIR|nr:hypothetical protein HJG60_010454 [Phyllostomus discolor]